MYANEYVYDSNYDDYYPAYKSSNTDIQNIRFVNSHINVNDIDVTQIPQNGPGVAATTNEGTEEGAANTQNGNGLVDRINIEWNPVNICVNYNQNEQIKVSPPYVEQTYEDCFLVLNQTQINSPLSIVSATSIQVYCDRLSGTPNSADETGVVLEDLQQGSGLPIQQIAAILECLVDSVLIDPPVNESGFCNDGIDNDHDGQTDGADFDCPA